LKKVNGEMRRRRKLEQNERNLEKDKLKKLNADENRKKRREK
jgi:hypothetical protein